LIIARDFNKLRAQNATTQQSILASNVFFLDIDMDCQNSVVQAALVTVIEISYRLGQIRLLVKWNLILLGFTELYGMDFTYVLYYIG
jgi:hypothetical protein